MGKKDKSILDGRPIHETGFPMSTTVQGPPVPLLVVAGNCPQCGAPIYGQRNINTNEEPKVQYSCNCRNERIAVEGLTQTKE